MHLIHNFPVQTLLQSFVLKRAVVVDDVIGTDAEIETIGAFYIRTDPDVRWSEDSFGEFGQFLIYLDAVQRQLPTQDIRAMRDCQSHEHIPQTASDIQEPTLIGIVTDIDLIEGRQHRTQVSGDETPSLPVSTLKGIYSSHTIIKLPSSYSR